MSFIKRNKKLNKDDEEMFETFLRLPNEEKVKLLMRYRKRIDKVTDDLRATKEFNPKHHNNNCISFDIDHIDYLIGILRGDSDE